MKLRLFSTIVPGLLLLAGCSKPSPEELFAKAQQDQRQAEAAADTTKDPARLRTLFAPALAAYGRIIDEYPKSEFAEPSLYMTGTIFNSNTHEFDRAVEVYKRFIVLYPDSKQSERVSFMIGYIYNNELHNLDSAAAAYRRFLERYPNAEMAASARYELSNLGKSPEELLPPDQPASPGVAAARSTKHPRPKH
jgi:outer membrane protein assembly factor BamD (BamD/ComL family)